MGPRRRRERWRWLVEESIQPVYFLAGAATYGPKWYVFAAVGLWIARAVALRTIWAIDDTGEWRCACPSDPNFDKSWNPRFVKRCDACGVERPLPRQGEGTEP